MSFTWGLDPSTNDLVINRSGKLVQVYGAEEVKQRIIVTLLHHWQEYFLNVLAGVPWYEVILGSKDKKLVDALIRKTVLDVPGVLSIVNYGSSLVSRQLDIGMVVEVLDETGIPSISMVDIVLSILNQSPSGNVSFILADDTLGGLITDDTGELLIGG